MTSEGQAIEKKSLATITGSKADFDAIARECVGFANARGGHFYIGIEDERIEKEGYGRWTRYIYKQKPSE